MPFSLAAAASTLSRPIPSGGRLDDLAGDLGGAPHDHGVESGDRLHELGFIHAGLDGHFKLRQGLELVDGFLIQRIRQ